MVIEFRTKWGPKIRFVYSTSFRVQLRSQLKKFPRRHFDAEAEKILPCSDRGLGKNGD